MHYLYNHVRIVLKFHEEPAAFNGARIVGFEVVPYSINHQWDRTEEGGSGMKLRPSLSRWDRTEEFDEYRTTLGASPKRGARPNPRGSR